ncbi:MAG: Flp pilus assembly protein CpaB [Bacillota bacterium]|jgi:Flp pilus assembly protein CpaB
MRSRFYFTLSVVTACLAGALLYAYLLSLDERVAVVVVARDVRRGEVLDESCLRLKSIHPSAAHPDAVATVREAVGRRVSVPLFRQEQVVSHKLAGVGIDGASGFLGSGDRAFLVPVPLARALGGMLIPGDTVDVVFVSDPVNSENPFSRVVLQGLEVLDIRNDRGASMEDDAQGAFLGVVLAVTPLEAEALALALCSGQVFLVGRGHEKGDLSGARDLDLGDLLMTGGNGP